MVTALVLVALGSVILLVACVLAKLYSDQTRPYPYEPRTEWLESEKLGPYYLSLTRKLAMRLDRDAQGAFLVVNPLDGTKYFNPLTNTHQALARFEKWIETGDQLWREEFLEVVGAILSHAVERPDGSLVLELNLRYYPDQRTPWISAMAQGQFIMVLLRAFQLTGQHVWLARAHQAAKPFQAEVGEGGVRSTDDLGVFYEEYAFLEPGRQHHTLNGMMSALMGLFELTKVSGDPTIVDLFETGVATIRTSLTYFEFPFCTAYDLRHLQGREPLMQSRYHSVHVAHLRIIGAMTKDGHFFRVADRWERKLHSRYNRLCLFAHYLTWKIRDLRNDRAVLGGWLRVGSSNLRRVLRRMIG